MAANPPHIRAQAAILLRSDAAQQDCGGSLIVADGDNYCNFAYSALACLRKGISESASSQCRNFVLASVF
jgi:hypothetical protein